MQQYNVTGATQKHRLGGKVAHVSTESGNFYMYNHKYVYMYL